MNTNANTLRKPLLNLLILLFFIHGVIYIFYPDQVYDDSSRFKFIKYIILMIIYLILLKEINIKNIISIFLLIVVMLIFHIYGNKSSNYILLLNYIFPLSITIFSLKLQRYVNFFKVATITFGISSFLAYIDFYIIKGIFTIWHHPDGFYREVSIFVNPNNFGLMIVLLLYFILFYQNDDLKPRKVIINLILIINAAIMVRLSGSNTALITLLISVVFYIYNIVIRNKFVNKKSCNKCNKLKISKIMLPTRKKLLITLSVILALLFIYMLYCNFNYLRIIISNINARTITLESAYARLSVNLSFINLIKQNILYPYKYNYIYVDNIYFHIWGTFGIFILIAFIMYNIFLIVISTKKRKPMYFCIIFIFLLMGFTTNYLYLWPLGYIYWAITSIILNEFKIDIKYLLDKLVKYINLIRSPRYLNIEKENKLRAYKDSVYFDIELEKFNINFFGLNEKIRTAVPRVINFYSKINNNPKFWLTIFKLLSFFWWISVFPILQVYKLVKYIKYCNKKGNMIEKIILNNKNVVVALSPRIKDLIMRLPENERPNVWITFPWVNIGKIPRPYQEIKFVDLINFKDVMSNIIISTKGAINAAKQKKSLESNLFTYTAFDWFMVWKVLESIVQDANSIWFCNHYDRWTFLIDNMEIKGEKILLQHGILASIGVEKITNINRIYYFNNKSKELFKNILFKNCKNVKYTQLSLSIDLKDISSVTNGKKSILIIGQPNAVNLHMELVKKIVKRFKNVIVFVKPHPLYGTQMYKDITNLPIILIEDKKFFPKTDIAVSHYSTLGWEYEASNIPVLWMEDTDIEQLLIKIEHMIAD